MKVYDIDGAGGMELTKVMGERDVVGRSSGLLSCSP